MEINIHIAGEDDLFDRFDADHTTLSPSFIAFLQGRYSAPGDVGTPVLNVCSDTPVDEARVRAAMTRYMESELAKNRRQRRHNRWVELYLFLLGVACITGGILLKDFNTVYLQVLSLTAGFAIKEAATIFFMKNPKNTIERARIMFISRSELRFTCSGDRGADA